MTLILLASTAISLAMGERVEALTIVAIVVLNALLGFFQEWRTERSLEKLNELAAPTATVIRDGHNQVIPAREVTISDLVLLKAGDRVPADCRILENQALLFDESLLTGESVPVEKSYTDHRTNDMSDAVCAFMGTIVSRGHGKAVVYAIGEDTRMGQIAVMLDSIDDEQTPLQKKLDQLGRTIAIGCLLICAVDGRGRYPGGASRCWRCSSPASRWRMPPSRGPARHRHHRPGRCRSTGWSRRMRSSAACTRWRRSAAANVICSDKIGTLTENR